MIIGPLLQLALSIIIILGAAWLIIWLVETFWQPLPGQIQKFIWLVAVIICAIKVAYWAGL